MFEKAHNRMPNMQESRKVFTQESLARHSAYLPESPLDVKNRHVMRGVAVAALVGELIYGGVKLPIEVNEAFLLPNSHASSLSEAIPPSDKATANTLNFVIGGLDIPNSTPIAKALFPLAELGSVYSIEEDPAGINAEQVANQLMKQAKAAGMTEIGLWGSSVGGQFITDVARYIQTNNTPIRVRYIGLDCMPVDTSDLRPDERAEIQAFQTIDTYIPHAEDHFVASWVVNAMMRNDDHLYHGDGGKGTSVGSSLQASTAVSSIPLLVSQVSLVLNEHFKDNMIAINNVSTKEPPFVFSVRATGNSDQVVNSDKNERKLKAIMKLTNLPSKFYSINNITHGNPAASANRTKYQQVLKSRIIPDILAYEAAYAQQQVELHTDHRQRIY